MLSLVRWEMAMFRHSATAMASASSFNPEPTLVNS